MPRRERDAWDDESATPKQLAFLARLGIPHSPDISLSDASDLISAAIEKRDSRKNWTLGCLLTIFAALVFAVFATLACIGLHNSN